jgi:aarF domain-containing kinase
LYDKEKGILNLIDFGAGREFDTDFLAQYLEIIHGSSVSDREKILSNSLQMGFLSGEENREMIEAHHTGVMIVGEPFRTSHPDELYDFA